MSRTQKLTRAAVLTALALVFLYAGAWVPRGGIALAALACLVGAVVLIECGLWWAVGHYAAVAVLALLLSPDKTPALWYALALGPYPVLKSLIERLSPAALRWALKLAVFCACVAALYFLFSAAFAASVPRLPVYVLLPALAAVFIVFDIAFTRLIGLYLRRVHRANRKEESL